MKSEPLTASSMTAFLRCPRLYFYRQEIGFRANASAPALKFGKAWHRAMELRWQGTQYEAALEKALEGAAVDEIVAETLAGLLAGYYTRYQEETLLAFRPEVEFSMPLRGFRSFYTAGKIDGLAIAADGRPALVEHKTTSDSIEPDSDYWLRLRADKQLYQYVLAARALGQGPDVVVYDVTRKPSIRQKQTETPVDFGIRLAADTLERPDFYFARREIPILEADLEAFQHERHAIARGILAYRANARKTARPEYAWPRAVTSMNCARCEFAGICLQNIETNPAQPPPGMILAKNEELSGTEGTQE